VSDPKLDFDLGGLANVVDFPGLASLVRGLVLEQVSSVAGAPKSVFVPLAELAETTATSKVFHSNKLSLLQLSVTSICDTSGIEARFSRMRSGPSVGPSGKIIGGERY
jgi:hypothetical protein